MSPIQDAPRFRARMLDLPTLEALSREMRRLEVDRGGIPLMAPKGIVRAILVEDVPTKAANIIKQEALARGGDLVTPWMAADFAADTVDVIVIGNVVTLRSLVAKLYRQTVYFLPEFADALQDVLMKTVPGYLPVARRPGRQGLVVEETLDDLFGGRIPTARGGRAVALPTLVPPPGTPDHAWHFGRETYMLGILEPEGGPLGGAPARADEAGPPEVLLERARSLVAAGARIVEVDAEGGAAAAGVAPLVRSLREALPGVLVAVRTTRAETARTALAAGAHLLVTGAALRDDPDLREVVAESGVPAVAVHAPPQPEYRDLMSDVARFFWDTLDAVTKAGARVEQLLLDPGLGLQKTHEQDLECTRRLRELTSFGRPLVYTPPARLAADPMGTAALVTLAVAGGADFVRVRDVGGIVGCVRTADALVRGHLRPGEPDTGREPVHTPREGER
ncbi:dihydropteroate synthase [Caldinitratiruptor microaerophilus]|uniref:Pterin-binding domain-containing protein n=1 Tax=Caldinitratiruptor microaerophilus TaxID=671077 RepID=A0AA35CP09_9FIRM|nr:dihydropteroate synthase [Caldinitratiruptor microaerophilus]BDG60911.1 hypothetical protein caldi_20010 [Caldinitratiruptor microaerophilus]